MLNLQKQNIVLLVILSIISFFTFLGIANLPVPNDLNLHNQIIKSLNDGTGAYGPHFLYFGIVQIISFFSFNIAIINVWASVLLGSAVTFKFIWTKNIVLSGFTPTFKFFKENFWLIPLVLAAFMFLTNMPSRPPFTHELPPISWQNSTTIFLFPFALALFYKSYCFLQNQTTNLLWQIAIIGFISILIKPNFMLVFGLVFPLFALMKFGFSKTFFKIIGVHIIFGLVIIAQFIYTLYLSKSGAVANYEDVQIVIAPFKAWSKITRSIPISFVLWSSFPVLFLFFYYKKIRDKGMIQYASAFFLVGFLIFILLNEQTKTGANVGAVNFLWQAIIVQFILFVVCFKEHLIILNNREYFKKKDYVLFGIQFYYVFAGFMYLINTVLLPYL